MRFDQNLAQNKITGPAFPLMHDNSDIPKEKKPVLQLVKPQPPGNENRPGTLQVPDPSKKWTGKQTPEELKEMLAQIAEDHENQKLQQPSPEQLLVQHGYMNVPEEATEATAQLVRQQIARQKDADIDGRRKALENRDYAHIDKELTQKHGYLNVPRQERTNAFKFEQEQRKKDEELARQNLENIYEADEDEHEGTETIDPRVTMSWEGEEFLKPPTSGAETIGPAPKEKKPGFLKMLWKKLFG